MTARSSRPDQTAPGSSWTSSTRRTWLMAAGLLVLSYSVLLNPHLDIKSFNAHDPANYLIGAQSIWRGEGYGMRFANGYIPMKLQPPGLYVLLAPVVGLFGMNFVAIKLFMVALAALMAWACWVMFRAFLPSKQEAMIATIVLMASPVIFGLSHQVLAEVPLILCCAVGLAATDQYLRASTPARSLSVFAAAASISAAYFFKGVGLAVLLGGWLLLLDRRWRRRDMAAKLLILTGLVTIPIVGWQIRCHFTPSVGFYGQSIGRFYLLRDPYATRSPVVSIADLLVRIRHNILWGMSANVAASLLAPLYFIRGSIVGCLLGLPLVVWLIGQWLRSCRHQASVLEGYTVVGMIALLLYIHGYAERYIAWLYPALLVYAMRGISAFPRRWHTLVPAGMLALSLGSTVAAGIDQWCNPFGSPAIRDYVAIAQKAKAEFPPQSLCLAPMEAHWHDLTEHSCFIQGVKELPLPSPTIPADYVVVLAHPEQWRESRLKNFERDLIQAALTITALTQRTSTTWVVADQNATFKLLKAVR